MTDGSGPGRDPGQEVRPRASRTTTWVSSGRELTVTCAFGCIDPSTNPPQFSITCVANCVALGCADVQFFVDQVLTCAIGVLPQCGGDFDCIQTECGEELAACIGAHCD